VKAGNERNLTTKEMIFPLDWASFFSFFLRNPCPKIFHYQHMIDKSINIEQVKALNLSASTKIKLIHSSIFINPRKKPACVVVCVVHRIDASCVVVCVVHRIDAACVVPTLIIVTVDSCMII
jgi:hypothetical protein